MEWHLKIDVGEYAYSHIYVTGNELTHHDESTVIVDGVKIEVSGTIDEVILIETVENHE